MRYLPLVVTTSLRRYSEILSNLSILPYKIVTTVLPDLATRRFSLPSGAGFSVDTSAFSRRGTAAQAALAVLCALILIGAVAVPARAQSCTVNATSDNGATGDILDCVNQANAAAANTTFTITFDPSLNGKTITLTSALTLNPTNSGVTINVQGPGANQLTISGGNAVQVFLIESGTVNISGLTISNGASDAGGGILNVSALTVSNSAFTGNQSGPGGAIFNAGTLTVTGSTFNGNTGTIGGAIATNSSSTTTIINSTFNGNTANVEGGALNIASSSAAAVSNTTISGNTGVLLGGGIFNAGTLTLADSIVAGNTTNLTPGDDCDGCGSQTSPNVIEINPGLAPLGNYGGPTQTMLPLPGSPAFCAGTSSLPSPLTLPATDQRGFPRTNTTYGGFNGSTPCVDVGAIQTNYQSIQFTNSGGAYVVQTANFFQQFGVTPPSSPAPNVSVTENGQNLGGVPITLAYTAPQNTIGALAGYGPVTTVAGTGATFSNLIAYFPGAYTLSATLTLFTPSGGQPVSITTNPIASLLVQGQPTITTLSQLGSFIVGSPFGFNGTVAPALPSITLPNGSGTLSIYNGTILIGQGTTRVLGYGPITFGIQVNNTYLPPDTYPITVVFNSSDQQLYASSSATGTLTITQDGVNITAGSSANPSTYGQPITLTATVAAAPFTGLQPTGGVTFTDTTTNTSLGVSGLTPISGVSGSGQASVYLPNGLSGGTHQIQAFYLGDVNYSSHGSVFGQTVNPAANTMTFTMPAPASAQFGSSFTVAAAGLGTGAITYASDGVVCTNAGSTFTMIQGSGTCTVTATQAADTNYQSGSMSESVAATLANSIVSVALTGGTNPALSGQAVTFTAVITSNVSLSMGGFVNWSANTGCKTTRFIGYPGTSTCTTSILPVGSDTITATYSGDANHNSASGSMALDVANPTTMTISPAVVVFANESINVRSAPKAVLLTNTGSSTLYVTGTATSGDFGISTSTCAIVPVGKRCELLIYFEPTQPGLRTGTLSITDNASGSPQRVSLSGTGLFNVTLTPSAVNYGDVVVGLIGPPKTFWLTNTSRTTPLSIVGPVTSGDFTLEATDCGASLAPGSRCWIDVSFAPTQSGTRTGQLTVQDSAGNTPQTSNLTGTGK